MKGILELPLTNNSVIPIIDNTQPVMINTIPVILFRFIVKKGFVASMINYFFLLLPARLMCHPQEYLDW